MHVQLINMMAMKTIFQRMLRKPGCDRALIVLAVFLCGRTAIAEGHYDFDRAGLTTGLIAGQDDWENLRGTTSAQVVSGGALNTSLVLSTSGGEAWCARINNGTFQVAFNATESDAVIQFQARLGLGPAMIGFGDPTTANRVMFGFQGTAVVVTAPGLLQLPPRVITNARTGDWMHLRIIVNLAPGSDGSAIIQVKNLTRGEADFTPPPGVPWPLGVNSLPAAQKPARWDRLLVNLGPAAALDNLVIPGRGGRDLNHRPVAVTGQPAPGLSSSIKFEGFDGSPAIGPNGQVVFAGRLLQGGGVGPANNRALWAGKPGQLGLVARTGSAAPGLPAGVKLESFNNLTPDINDDGDTAFAASLVGPGVDEVNAKTLWFGQPGALRLVARSGVPFAGDQVVKDILNPRTLHGSGLVACESVLNGSDRALWAGPVAAPQLVVRTGVEHYLALAERAWNRAGNVLFTRTIPFGEPSQRTALIVGNATSETVVAALVDSVPPWANNGMGDLNDRGDVFFFTDGKLILKDFQGVTTTVATVGEEPPGLPGQRFFDFLHPRVSQSGLVAFQARFGPQSQPETVAGSGCWVGRPGALRLLAATGQPAPGIVSSFAGVGEIAFNDRDQVAFRARLNEAGPGLHQSLWATDTAGELHLLLREGDYLDAGANLDRQVKEWTGGFVGGGTSPRNFSKGGEVAVSVTFTDNSQAVEVFRVPGAAVVASPEITASPLTQTAWLGGTVTFSVTATGEGPLTYRWLHDHQPVAGQTGPTLTLDNLKSGDAGEYQAEVTNAGGSVLSAVAQLTVENPEADTDGDGLSDGWEIQNGFNRNDPTDAAGDPDEDGWTNLQEFIAGTNPRDPKSFLSVELRSVGGAIRLNFLAISGKGYSLLFKDRLSDANWQKLRDVPPQATDHQEDIEDLTAGPGERFYRLVTPPAP